MFIEGTTGTVYAWEPASRELPVETAGEVDVQIPAGTENPEEGDRSVYGGEGEPVPGKVKKQAEGETSVSDETESPAEGETPVPDETENPAGGETSVPDETENPVGGETPEPDESESPAEGETPEPDESESPTEDGETDASAEKPVVSENTISENTISENTTEDEADQVVEEWSGAHSVGEPPLMTEGADGYAASAYSSISPAAEGIRRQTPGISEIIDRYKAYPWSLNVADTYSEKPSTTNPYKAGHLTGSSLENTLNLLNFIRYVAGIPADVTLNEDYIELTQAGALVNCVNKKLTHEPEQPDGFPDDLYAKAKRGCGSSNIAWNYGNMAQSLLKGWMFDGDSGNIDRMGHRRWVLNPSMTQTGFGTVGAYSAMYAFDSKGSSITDYVAWPAQNMPIELMNGSGTPWTLSLGSDYEKANFQNVSVTLRDVTNNKSWNFSSSKANGVFKVNIEYFGMPNCIIFRPNDVSYSKNSQFQVTVKGIKTKDGKEATVSYNVDFFSLSDLPKEVERVTLDKVKLHLLLDEEGKNQGALHASLEPSNAEDKTLTWNSLNEAVAKVNENGVVTAVGVGETTVTATAVNKMQAACTVKVSDYSLSADGIEFDENTGIYDLGFQLQGGGLQGEGKKLTVKDGGNPATDVIWWSSENQNVAAVDADGVVTPVGVGEARIWANVENGLKILSCEVKVENVQLPDMQMRESRRTMKKGETGQLKVYLSPSDTKWGKNGQKYIKWMSDSDAVAFAFQNEDGTISGNTVTVAACEVGKATITAEIVDEAGQPAGDGVKGKASCEVVVQQTAMLPAEADRPCPIALTNVQSTLQDVALPEGWSWKYPDTSLAQFAGQRSKTFPAAYQTSEDALPAETLLPVYFLTVESISVRVKHADETNVVRDVSVLKSGWVAHCYVNYSFEETLEQFEEKNAELENNTWYQNQKKELLNWLDKSIILSSSNPQVIRVESVKNAAGKTTLSAAAPGDAALKAELRLGSRTFKTSCKLTVAENAEADFKVTWLGHFAKTGEEDSHRYAAQLGDFPTEAPGGINSGIRLEMTGVTRLTVKSSNSKVVALKSSTVKPAGTVQFEIPLMVRAAGTAQITVTGDDPAKTSHTLTLVVTDACPGISEETVTVNTWQIGGTDFSLYAAKDASGSFYQITDVYLEDVEKFARNSDKFVLTSENAPDGSRRNCSITAKADTETGTYKMRLYVRAGEEKAYDLPLTVKVVSAVPKCSVRQKNKLNLFYRDTKSLLSIDTEEKIDSVSLTGCNYLVELSSDGGYYVKPGQGATLNSVKKGTLKIQMEGWKPFEVPFTVGVEKQAIKISPVTDTVTLYPKYGLVSARIGIKNAGTFPWENLKIEGYSTARAKGNYEPILRQEEQSLLLKGKNLNQAENVRMTIRLRGSNWTESVDLTCNVKVNMGQPAITLENKTLQLNANEAYKGYDAASTAVKWKGGGVVTTDHGVRVSVYCDPKDARAKALVSDSSVIFSVGKYNGCYQVKVRLNNKTVAKGTYKYTVQAAKDGKIWKTPLVLKVVDTAPDKAVKIVAKGSIDVLSREGSFMTLTPSLKAVGGEFLIPESGEVGLTGRDAHLFRATWSLDGKTIELRARENVTLVTKYQYTVTPLLILRNVNGETEEVKAPTVKFKVKQGSAKVTALPKTALMYSSAYNAVEIDMQAVLKGAPAPEIERVVLSGNTDAFAYVYNKEGKGTLTMRDTGRAVKGKTYSLQLKVYFAEQADNVKPVTVRYKVKVK